MTGRYEIDAPRRINVVTYAGRLDLAGIFELLMALNADPQFDPGYDTLTDYTGVTDLQITPDDIHAIHHALENQDARTGRIAMVLGEDRSHHAYVKVCTAAMTPELRARHGIFQSRAEAEAWLGLMDVRAIRR